MDRRQLNPSNSSCIAGEIVNVMSRTYTKPYKTHPNPLHLVESMSPHHLPHQATHGLLHHLHTSLVHLGILKCLEEFLPTQHLTRTLYFGAFVGPKKVVLKLCIVLECCSGGRYMFGEKINTPPKQGTGKGAFSRIPIFMYETLGFWLTASPTSHLLCCCSGRQGSLHSCLEVRNEGLQDCAVHIGILGTKKTLQDLKPELIGEFEHLFFSHLTVIRWYTKNLHHLRVLSQKSSI